MFETASTYSTNASVKEAAGLTDEATSAENTANVLHSLLDSLELRLFGPAPREVGVGVMQDANAPAPPPVLGHSLRNTRQRLDQAASRLDRIIGRI